MFYPGLPSHPHHEVAKRQMSAFGGMVVFEVAGGFQSARTLIEVSLSSEEPKYFRVDPGLAHLMRVQFSFIAVGLHKYYLKSWNDVLLYVCFMEQSI